jgi:hypothetical protein
MKNGTPARQAGFRDPRRRLPEGVAARKLYYFADWS